MEFFSMHSPRPLSSTNSLDGKYFQLDDSSEGNKIINWNKDELNRVQFARSAKRQENDT